MAVNFPAWARLLLGIVLAAAGYLIAGEIISDETTRGALAVLVGFISSAGIVPPRPEDFNLSPAVRWVLTGLVSAGSYFLTTADGLDATLRGIIQAAVYLLATLFIVPPQATGTPHQ